MRSLKISLMVLLVATLLLVGTAGVYFRLFERGWFHFTQWQQGDVQEVSLGLSAYQAVVQHKEVVGIEEDLSALAYDPDRNSLIAVTNSNPHWLEISLDGELLRKIPLVGFVDPESIEYISAGVYVICDEHEHRLLRVEVNEQTTVIDAQHAQQLSLRIDLSDNKGFEGLAYDNEGKRLFVAKERDPVLIYAISGFPFDRHGPSLDISEHPAQLFVRDLSAMQYDAQTGHLLALSDESRLVVELGEDGEAISTLSLSAGKHGLNQHVPQAEGLAMGPDRTLYLISEPNLFYVFRKSAR